MMTPKFNIESWIDRCTARLMALDPYSPLDGTDLDDLSHDLWAADAGRTPEAAAEEWHRIHGPACVPAP